jgi:uncharacterized membrane protein
MTDRRTILAVVILLGVLAIAGLAGVVFLISTGHSQGEVAVVVALAGPPAGALGSLLVSTKSSPGPEDRPLRAKA